MASENLFPLELVVLVPSVRGGLVLWVPLSWVASGRDVGQLLGLFLPGRTKILLV